LRFRNQHIINFHALFALVILFLFIMQSDTFGQNTRLSGGYTLRNFSIDAIANPDNSSQIPQLQKGSVHLEIEQLFRHSFFMGFRTDYLVHNREFSLTGGPVDFNQASIKGSLGLQWNRIGIYTGVNAGYLWDLSFQPAGDLQPVHASIDPSGEAGSFFGGIHIGARYYLFKFLRLEAEFRNPVFAKNRFEPNRNQTASSQLSSIRFQPTQFSIGVSLSIPIRSSSRRPSSAGRRTSPPPLFSATGSVRFQSPVDGPANVTSTFGRRWGRMHEGVDIDARKGDRILAAADGTVVEAKTSVSYGRMVVVRHNASYTTYYTHLSRINVEAGDRIRAGDVVGLAGDTGVATGVHLHFEVRRDGVPVDPERYIRF
jgi:hypothetical protein